MKREKPVVLLADDDKNITRALKIRLTHAGFEVITANDGDSAIAAFDKALPDVVLLDVDMPGADGFAVCEHIRSDIGDSNIPVVFMTGADAGIIRNYLERLSETVGGSGEVTKPYDPTELTTTLWNAVNHPQSSNKPGNSAPPS